MLSEQWPIHVSPLELKWPMYISPLVARQPMRWASLLFCFVLINVFRFMHHSLENRGACVDTQKCPPCKVVQNEKWTSPLRSSRRDSQKTYMERSNRSPDARVMASGRLVENDLPVLPVRDWYYLSETGTTGCC